MSTDAHRTYRAALYGEIPLTNEEQSNLSDDELIEAGLSEARKPGTGLEMLAAEDLRIDTWTS